MTGTDQIRGDIRDFLTSRRARVTPEQAGLPSYGGTRRVAGLRREEVAVLAGISVEYYTQLERGHAAGVSDGVFEGVARALRLDAAERAHLRGLVHAAGAPASPRRRTPRPALRPPVQRILDAMADTPAFVLDGTLDILGSNALGRLLYAPLYDGGGDRPNHARFVFLDPASHAFWADWPGAADITVALLRAQSGRDPSDRALSDLVGELSTLSEEFRTRWASHDVRLHDSGTKYLHHPVVGDLALPWESLPVAADAGLSLLVYTPEPGSATRAALDVLVGGLGRDRSAAVGIAPRAPTP